MLARITDTREIARYLGILLDSRNPNFIPVSIEELRQVTESEIELTLHFAPKIAGLVRLRPNARVKVVKEASRSFLKRLLPWIDTF